MIIGITASQGQGKSTLINEFCKTYNIGESANIQTARELLKEYGLSLNEVNKFHDIKRQFQDELLEKHYRALVNLKDQSQDKIVFVERTFIDIFIYALVSLGPLNDYSDWLNEYYESCKKAQNECFDGIIKLTGRENANIEDDGVRSTNKHFSRMVDGLIKMYFDEFSKSEDIIVMDINVSSLEYRIQILHDLLRKYI